MRRAFTLIELIVVIVVVAILVGVALPKFFNWSDEAKAADDQASLGAVNAALAMAFAAHRMQEAAAAAWVDEVADVPALMEGGALPDAFTVIDADTIEDQRGNRYDLNQETAAASAYFELVP
jgi:prepilin-type N-terminal cleavage/methylation domain-containing protein